MTLPPNPRIGEVKYRKTSTPVTEECSAYIPHTQNNPVRKLKTSDAAKKNSNFLQRSYKGIGKMEKKKLEKCHLGDNDGLTKGQA